MHELAHNITMTRQKFDLVLVQEAWWNVNITTSFQGWQVILPTTIKENDCPRVIPYYKLQAGVEITLRTDTGSDLDFMILDIKCEGSRHLPTCIINLYNQTEPGEIQNPSFTTDRLASINIHPGMPTVITGDWNLHHNNWNSLIDKESTPTRTQEVVDWLEGQGFSLCSERDVYTRSGAGTQRDTIIDLTFANEPAIGQGVVHNHSVNPDLTLLSDHNALTFTLGDPRESVVNIAKAKYNWKDAIEEDFTKALNQELHADAVLYDTSIQQILNKQCTHATPEELDTTVRFINTCMEQAAEKAVPTCWMCSRCYDLCKQEWKWDAVEPHWGMTGSVAHMSVGAGQR